MNKIIQHQPPGCFYETPGSSVWLFSVGIFFGYLLLNYINEETGIKNTSQTPVDALPDEIDRVMNLNH